MIKFEINYPDSTKSILSNLITILAFDESNEKLGYIELINHIGSENYFLLNLLYIEPEYRNKSIANKLMEYFVNTLPSIAIIFDINKVYLYAESLELNLSNSILIKFYKKFGFKNKPGHKSNFLYLSC